MQKRGRLCDIEGRPEPRLYDGSGTSSDELCVQARFA